MATRLRRLQHAALGTAPGSFAGQAQGAVLLLLVLVAAIQVRGFAAALVGLVYLLGAWMLLRGELRPRRGVLAAAAFGLAAGAYTLAIRPDTGPGDLGHAAMLFGFSLVAAACAQRRQLAWPRAVDAGIAAICGAGLMTLLALSLVLQLDNTSLQRLNLISDTVSKEVFVLVPLLWLSLARVQAAWPERRLWPLLVLPIAFALLSAGQSISVGLALGLMAAVFASGRVLLWAGAAGIAAIPVVSVVALPALGFALPDNWAERIALWQEALRLWRENPLLGWGIQAFEPLANAANLERVTHAHSATFAILVDFGLVGALALAVAFWAAAGALARRHALRLGERVRWLTPLFAWLFVIAVSFDPWADYVVAASAILLAVALAPVEGAGRGTGVNAGRGPAPSPPPPPGGATGAG